MVFLEWEKVKEKIKRKNEQTDIKEQTKINFLDLQYKTSTLASHLFG